MLYWWRTWHDDHRRLWADRQQHGDPAEAKRQHTADRRFGWVQSDMAAPAVGPLIFTDHTGRDSYIAASQVRETDADRQFNIGATPTPTSAPKAADTPPPAAPAPDDDLPF